MLLCLPCFSQTYYIALSGTDCYACEVNLNELATTCLSDAELTYVFPESFKSDRHWSKDLKEAYQPHIFNDSLMNVLTGGSPLSMLGCVKDGRITDRFIVKQMRCSDLQIEMDTLDFNTYMTGIDSDISYYKEKFMVIENGHAVYVASSDGEVEWSFTEEMLLNNLGATLSQLGLTEEQVAHNLLDSTLLKTEAKPFTFCAAIGHEHRMRIAGSALVVERDKDSPKTLFLVQKQFILDYDRSNESIEIISLPNSPPGVEDAYFSMYGSKFVSFDSLLVKNATYVNDDAYGLLLMDDAMNVNYHRAPPIRSYRMVNGIRYGEPIMYQYLSGELFVHSPYESRLVSYTGDTLKIDTHTAQEVLGDTALWMEVVIADGDQLIPFYNSEENGLVYFDRMHPVQVSTSRCEYLGKDESYWYFHKYSLSGTVIRYKHH